MSNPVRLVLVDPSNETRAPLLDVFRRVPDLQVQGTETSYDLDPLVLAATPRDLTVVVLDTNPSRGCELVSTLLRTNPRGKVVPASSTRDAEFLLQLFRAGCSEFLLLPTSPEEVVGVLARLSRRSAAVVPVQKPPGRVIAVAGASGGVGCTSLAVNLAVALKQEGGGEVVLGDYDLISGQVAAWLETGFRSSLVELCQHVHRLDHLLLRRGLYRHEASGLMILPHLEEISEAVQIDPEQLRQLTEMLREAFDVVVLDTSKGLHATDVAAFEQADVILLVVQLDVMCLHSTVRLLKLFRSLDHLIDKVRVVLNRVGSGAAEIRVKKVEEALELPIFWRIPNAFRAFHAARSHGHLIKPDSTGREAFQALHGLARGLITDTREPSTDEDDAPIESGNKRRSNWWLGLGGRAARPAASSRLVATTSKAPKLQADH